MKAVLAICVLLVLPAAAQADRVSHMARHAQETFGLPCLKASTEAMPWGQIGQSDFPGCQVEITNQRLSRKDTCLVVFHEAGHKAGLPHSPDPDNIMFPRPLEVRYPPCLRYDLLELRLTNLREDLDTARRFDHDRTEARRLVRQVRRTKRTLGP